MWSWSLNWAEITSGIVVGTCPRSPDDLERVHRGTGVSAVLSLQHDECHRYWHIDYARMREEAGRLGLELRRCPMRDLDIDDQRRRLADGVAALAETRAAGHRTYAHCTAGMGRAPLVVLGYLTWVKGWGRERAIQQILENRPEAVPSWEAYEGARADLVERHRPAIARRAHELHESGANESAEADWLQAETEILRTVLLPTGPAPSRDDAACRSIRPP